MNLNRALAHLAGVGVTTEVLHASGIDPTDPTAVRREVEILLASAVAEVTITDMRGLTALQRALADLLTDAERGSNDALAKALRTDLVAAGVIRPAALPEPDEAFEACLAEV